MREILFRAKKSVDEQWAYGVPVYDWNCDETKRSIEKIQTNHPTCNEIYFILKDTIGQYTGLLDKNGNKIFEGDILKIANGSVNGHVIFDIQKVVFLIDKEYNYPGFTAPNWAYFSPDYSHNMEIIGNIYDNPELLKE